MNKTQASKLAEIITNAELKQMFDNAKQSIKNWDAVSNVNKGMTKGTSWNILAKDFNPTKDYLTIVKKNMIWEFGDYLPKSILYSDRVKNKKVPKQIVHQEPVF